jgi:hypothetical protein
MINTAQKLVQYSTHQKGKRRTLNQKWYNEMQTAEIAEILVFLPSLASCYDEQAS